MRLRLHTRSRWPRRVLTTLRYAVDRELHKIQLENIQKANLLCTGWAAIIALRSPAVVIRTLPHHPKHLGFIAVRRLALSGKPQNTPRRIVKGDSGRRAREKTGPSSANPKDGLVRIE